MLEWPYTVGARGRGVLPCSTGIRWGVSPAAQMGCWRNRSGSPSGGRPAVRGKRTYGGRPGQRVEEQGTRAAQKHSKAGYGRPVDRGVWTAKTVKRPRQQPAQPPIRQLLGAADTQTAQPRHIQHSPSTPTTGLRERGNDTSRSTGRSGRQNAATRRNMRREERVTVQAPVKEQQPDGMSHGGYSPPPPPQTKGTIVGSNEMYRWGRLMGPRTAVAPQRLSDENEAKVQQLRQIQDDRRRYRKGRGSMSRSGRSNASRSVGPRAPEDGSGDFAVEEEHLPAAVNPLLDAPKEVRVRGEGKGRAEMGRQR